MQELQESETLEAHDQAVLSTLRAEPGSTALSPGQEDAKVSEAEATLEGQIPSFPEPCPIKNIKKAFPELHAAFSALDNRGS